MFYIYERLFFGGGGTGVVYKVLIESIFIFNIKKAYGGGFCEIL
jgi:hypothetical protein